MRLERARIFVGCEGHSERGYAAWLASLARDAALAVAVDPHILKEGDPLSRIKWASACIEREEGRRGTYAAKFAFLDTDQRDGDPERAAQTITLAQRSGIVLVWQEPDHEGLLLDHFDHSERRRPRSKADSMQALQRLWPGYEKNSTAQQYGSKLGREHLERAGARHADLNTLLKLIGLF